MADEHREPAQRVEILDWTIPSPRGLWYRAIVLVGPGVFVTAEIDVTMLKRIRNARADGPRAVSAVLLDHGRFKRPEFLRFNEITGVKLERSTGLMHIASAATTVSVRVPDRHRLESLGHDFGEALRDRGGAAS